MALYPANDGYLNASQPSGNGPQFILLGGLYQIATVGLGSGNLGMIGPDGVSSINAVAGTSFGANGTLIVSLGPGTYFFIASTSGAAAVTKIKKS